MLKNSYKKIIKEIPEFQLKTDRIDVVEMETTLDATISWKGNANIVIQEQNDDVNLTIIRRGTTIFSKSFSSEEEANTGMFEKLTDLRKNIVLECVFS